MSRYATDLYIKVAISLLRSWSIERKGRGLIEPFTLGCFSFISLTYFDSNLTQTQILTVKLTPNLTLTKTLTQTQTLTIKQTNKKFVDERFSFSFYSN